MISTGTIPIRNRRPISPLSPRITLAISPRRLTHLRISLPDITTTSRYTALRGQLRRRHFSRSNHQRTGSPPLLVVPLHAHWTAQPSTHEDIRSTAGAKKLSTKVSEQGFSNVAFRAGPCACGASSYKKMVRLWCAFSAPQPHHFLHISEPHVQIYGLPRCSY